MASYEANCSGSTGVESPRRGLRLLPNEILQTITSLLPSDKDVVNFSLVCKEIWERVLATNSTIWRRRFSDKYDTPRDRTAIELMWEYQIRAIVLPQKIDFGQRTSERHNFWLELIQTLIHEVLTLPAEIEDSKTYSILHQVMTTSNFLNHPKRDLPSELFCAVQLCLTPLALDSSITSSCTQSGYDIEVVYSYQDEIDGPFIKHNELDLATLLHMRSFWQYHLGYCENTFQWSYLQLSEAEKPRMPKGRRINDPGLSPSWLGFYSCIHPLPDTSEDFTQRETCADLEDHLEQVEIMTLQFNSRSDEFWPEKCNSIIPQADDYNNARVYFEGVQNALGPSLETANPLFGFVEPIATPYGGFEGWSRICFIIYEGTDEDEDNSWDTEDRWVHGYEAAILPGGGVMLGRWIDMNDTSGRGPFIFWDI